MTTPADSQRWVAVFDLDGTLTWHDSLMLFLLSFLRRHPRRLLGLWRLPWIVLSFAAGNVIVVGSNHGLSAW